MGNRFTKRNFRTFTMESERFILWFLLFALFLRSLDYAIVAYSGEGFLTDSALELSGINPWTLSIFGFGAYAFCLYGIFSGKRSGIIIGSLCSVVLHAFLLVSAFLVLITYDSTMYVKAMGNNLLLLCLWTNLAWSQHVFRGSKNTKA